MKEKPTVGAPFFGTFIPTASLRGTPTCETEKSLEKQSLQIISSNNSNVTSDIRGCFEAIVIMTFWRWAQGILVKTTVLLK